MNFSLISLLISLSLIQNSFQQVCNETGFNNFDELASKILTIGNFKIKFPENLAQMKVWCKQGRGFLGEFEKFNQKCNNNLFKKMVNLYVYGFRRTSKLYCRDGSKLGSILLQSSPCYNNNKKLEVSCVTDFIDAVLGIQNEQVHKKKIPHFCCAFSKFVNCFEERLSGQPQCNENKLTAMKNYLLSTTTNVIDFICGDYKEDSDKCNQLGEPPKKKNSQRRTKSPALPSAQLFESIPEL